MDKLDNVHGNFSLSTQTEFSAHSRQGLLTEIALEIAMPPRRSPDTCLHDPGGRP
ncbi:hypothetical protein [Polaromonas sp. CG9_12]|nr:hypothetical protein [Polaromonas sp. CG9_12]